MCQGFYRKHKASETYFGIITLQVSNLQYMRMHIQVVHVTNLQLNTMW